MVVLAFGVTKVFVTAFLASKLGLLRESELLPLSELLLDNLLLELSEPLEAGTPLGAGFAPAVAGFFLAPAEELLDTTDSTCESADNTESSAPLPMRRAISSSDSRSSPASSASFWVVSATASLRGCRCRKSKRTRTSRRSSPRGTPGT